MHSKPRASARENLERIPYLHRLSGSCFLKLQAGVERALECRALDIVLDALDEVGAAAGAQVSGCRRIQ